jgi:hypothetical protein
MERGGPKRIHEFPERDQRARIESTQDPHKMLARDNCDRCAGQGHRLEQLRSAAPRVGEVPIPEDIARTRQRDQHALARPAGAVDFDHPAEHHKNHVGGRARGEEPCALRIAHQGMAHQDCFAYVAREPGILKRLHQPLAPPHQSLLGSR